MMTSAATPRVSHWGTRMVKRVPPQRSSAPPGVRPGDAVRRTQGAQGRWRIDLTARVGQEWPPGEEMPHPTAKYRNSAAFYDVDGTLIRTNIVHAFAFYAQRQP